MARFSVPLLLVMVEGPLGHSILYVVKRLEYGNGQVELLQLTCHPKGAKLQDIIVILGDVI